MRIFRVLAWISLGLGLTLAGVVGYAALSTQVQTSGSLELAGLSGPVTITRDSFGIPHIKASTDEDAVQALGFVHAQDRLWQMDFQRRVGAGRLSEVLGKGALEKDKFLRTWGFYRAAQQNYAGLSDRSKRLLLAYAKGVNAFIEKGNLPLEFTILRYRPEPWKPEDSLVWQKMMAFDLSDNWQGEKDQAALVAKLGQEKAARMHSPYPKLGRTILSSADLAQSDLLKDQESTKKSQVKVNPQNLERLNQLSRVVASLNLEPFDGKGSNNWVVSGRFTQSGKPLLADDPHLSMSAPSLWYLASLEGKTLKVVGTTIPGLPAMVIGRNAQVAWGVTNAGPDTQDLFVEDKNVVLESRVETIKIKGEPDLALTVKTSKHGPIISSENGQNLALRWTALEPNDTTMDAFLDINFAQNWQEFTSALERYVVPSQNFVYADTSGNIGYYAPGKIPIRNGWDGTLPASGSQNWVGYIPFNELPHVYNPPEGLIVTANNRITPDGYLHTWGSDGLFAKPFRADRISELLEAGKAKKLSLEDMVRIQNDVVSNIWLTLEPDLLKVVAPTEREKDALERLKKWDGNLLETSSEASIFAAWYSELAKMPVDELGKALPAPYFNDSLWIKAALERNDPYCQENGAGDCATWLHTSFARAISMLEGKFGQYIDTWQWSELHKAEMRHGAFDSVGGLREIWTRATPNAGGLHTVNVGSYELDTFMQHKGPGYRQVIDLGNPTSSLFVNHLGQSGNPFVHSYTSFIQLWRTGKYAPMVWDGVGEVLTLTP
jgi:penicillin G amidase